jgi:hypothetical protein
MKRVQLYIHKHFQTIMLVIILALMLGLLVSFLANFESSAKQRGEAVKEVVRVFSVENEKQTELINDQFDVVKRQFSAICVLMIEVSPQSLERLDKATQQRCRQLDREEAEDAAQRASERRSGTSTSSSSSQRSTAPAPGPSKPRGNTEPPNPTEPEPEPTVAEALRNLINAPFKAIGL